MFKDIWEESWGYLSKKCFKKQCCEKNEQSFEKNEKMKKYAKIIIIMVRKLNYLKNHAELYGQWWNLMDKGRY